MSKLAKRAPSAAARSEWDDAASEIGSDNPADVRSMLQTRVEAAEDTANDRYAPAEERKAARADAKRARAALKWNGGGFADRRVSEDDDELEVIDRVPETRGKISYSTGRDDMDGFGAFLGVPWWGWVAGAAAVGGVVAWWFATRREPSPEANPVPPEIPVSPNVDLTDVGAGFRLERAAAAAYLRMKAAAAAVGVDLPISNAWRSYENQMRLYEAWQAYKAGRGPAAPMAAKPGLTAPHQRGIAVDLTGVDHRNPNFNAKRRAWLDANAAAYGFKNTGMTFSYLEPWHWEYKPTAVA